MTTQARRGMVLLSMLLATGVAIGAIGVRLFDAWRACVS